MLYKGVELKDLKESIYGYKGRDFKNFDLKDWFQFAKANKEFKEPGLSYDELRALHEGLEGLTIPNPTIFETGQCFGTSTRFFLLWIMKYGGNLTSCEVNVRDPFKNAMKEFGLWDKFTTIDGDAMKISWKKDIDFLFLDSEHSLSYPLGEYMKYRLFLSPRSRIAFHDTDMCYGVHRAIEIIAGEIDSLRLVSESKKVRGAGLKVYELDAHNVIQNRINTEKQKDKSWRGWMYPEQKERKV